MFNVFKQPTAEQYATRNLKEARLLLLKALASREYADSIVSQKVVEIKRLEKFLEEAETKAKAKSLADLEVKEKFLEGWVGKVMPDSSRLTQPGKPLEVVKVKRIANTKGEQDAATKQSA